MDNKEIFGVDALIYSDNGQPFQEIDLMQEIIDYNEVDCKVMMEIVAYLRKYH